MTISFMKKNQEKKIEGIIFKGRFCPYWGGVNINKSQSFFTDRLYDISVNILANNHSAAVIEVYEEDERKDIQDCRKQPEEPI